MFELPAGGRQARKSRWLREVSIADRTGGSKSLPPDVDHWLADLSLCRPAHRPRGPAPAPSELWQAAGEVSRSQSDVIGRHRPLAIRGPAGRPDVSMRSFRSEPFNLLAEDERLVALRVFAGASGTAGASTPCTRRSPAGLPHLARGRGLARDAFWRHSAKARPRRRVRAGAARSQPSDPVDRQARAGGCGWSRPAHRRASEHLIGA